MNQIQWENIFNLRLAIESIPYLVKGIPYTILISFLSMGIGLLGGFFIALGRMSSIPILRTLAAIYISFMRGVPIMIILFILYFGLPNIGIQLPALTAAIIGFSINCAAYMAEIFRSIISSIDRGQWEAASTLGIPYWKAINGIIMPQVLNIAIPPLSNVLLDLVKASSLAAMITVPEMFQHARIIGGRELDYMTMYILIASMYWAICTLLSLGQQVLEKKFNVYT